MGGTTFQQLFTEIAATSELHDKSMKFTKNLQNADFPEFEVSAGGGESRPYWEVVSRPRWITSTAIAHAERTWDTIPNISGV